MNSQSLIIPSSDTVNVFLSVGATLLRLLINIFISIHMVFARTTNKWLILLVVITTVVLDYYDGVFFKKTSLHHTKYWRVNRRILDSVSDRLIIQIGCLSLLIVDVEFLPFYLTIIFREIFISGYCSNKYNAGFLIYPDNLARIASAFIALVVVSYLFMPLYFTSAISIIMLTLSCLSFLSYRRRFAFNQSSYENHLKNVELIEVN